MPSEFIPTTQDVWTRSGNWQAAWMRDSTEWRNASPGSKNASPEWRSGWTDREGCWSHTRGLLTQIWKRLDIPEDDKAFQEVRRLQVAGDH